MSHAGSLLLLLFIDVLTSYTSLVCIDTVIKLAYIPSYINEHVLQTCNGTIRYLAKDLSPRNVVSTRRQLRMVGSFEGGVLQWHYQWDFRIDFD